MKANIGIIGLSVMGSNLALNLADHGYKVALYNRSVEKLDDLLEKHPHENFVGTRSLQQLSDSLQSPRMIMLMVKAGKAVDMVIDSLLPVLNEGDIIIDGGNSYFMDTQNRYEKLKEKGIHFFGIGVSGGEEGARKGPALMPGGDEQVYKNHVQQVMETIAAHVNGVACCKYTSTGGAGHYVKMVHNGIEYGDMQLLGESYFLLKYLAGKSNKQLADLFGEWNKGELSSYLVEITSKIFKVADPQGEGELVDAILDYSRQKGTGKWMSEQALELQVDTSVISSAVNARYMSSLKELRQKASKLFNHEFVTDSFDETFVEDVRKSLYVAKIISYAQGFYLLRQAAKTYNWEFKYDEIASIFRGGCIIQAELLQPIIEAFQKNSELETLLFDEYFKNKVEQYLPSLRRVVVKAVQHKIPVTAFMNALGYVDTLTSENLSANLIQAQRDYFGAHLFERRDQKGQFHFDWVQYHGE